MSHYSTIVTNFQSPLKAAFLLLTLFKDKKMKKIFIALTVCLTLTFLSACATIMRENSQNVSIRSNIDQVDIKVLNKNGEVVFNGKTPTTINLKTSANGYFNPEKYTVIASKNGYKTEQKIIDWHVSGWYYVGNLVVGGLLGYLIIDPITGDMYYLDENAYINMSTK